MILAMVATAAIAACSTPYSAGDDADGGAIDGSVDGTVAESAVVDSSDGRDSSDGGDGGNGGDGGDGSLVNLLENGGFEQACSAGIWGTNEAILTEDTTAARTGMKSCLVCGKNDAGSWSINQEVPLALAAGQTYTAEAWVRRPPVGVAANPISVPIEARKDFTVLQGTVSSQDTATATWKLFKVTITLDDAGAAGTKMHMGVIGELDGCFLVDDAALYRVP